MRWLLQLVPFVFVAAAHGAEHGIRISTLPEDIASAVYEGRDSEMPIDAEFAIALTPRVDKSGNIVVPENIRDSFAEMRALLPRWYLSALFKSYGDNECSVVVNGTAYTALVANWLWVKWDIAGQHSKLGREFEHLGIRSRDRVLQALDSGFCEYLRHGPDAGLKEIESFRDRGTTR